MREPREVVVTEQPIEVIIAETQGAVEVTTGHHPLEVKIIDIDIPWGSVIGLMLQVVIGLIPVAIVIWILVVLLGLAVPFLGWLLDQARIAH